MRTKRPLRTTACLLVPILGCGGAGEAGADGSAGVAEGSGSQTPAAVLVDRPVDEGALSRFLPETFAGLDRNAIRSLSQDFQGATSTGVEADYGPPSPGVLAPVSITIWDHGASEYWQSTYALLQYETEERNGDELTRHTKFRGHPAGETESRRAGRTDAGMEIFVVGRYLVDIQTLGIPLDELRGAAESLDIAGLADLDGSP